MTQTRTDGYAPIQIGLHWLMAAMVLFQLIFGESMAEATEAAEEGEALSNGDAILATAHYWVGVAILVLVAARLIVRLRYGAPAPLDSNPLMVAASKVTHGLFYLLLVIVPISGLVAVHLNPEVGEIHELAKPAFILLILVHAGAALFHHFVLRDRTLVRMLAPTKARTDSPSA
ncbi:cytochrome b [Devosia aquimaris]|uniref:cytochrome b n=1 Tax=Devosia aquimaris TaxID=2866214 RepID=UPI001CD0EF8E|nr:cytochrome b/b6 domain-containing protein [Devosia sp. CJK-A8-3]